jgi:hypothetical protein
LEAEGKQRTVPGSVLGETTVIVLAIRGRPVSDHWHLQNMPGILAIWPVSDKRIFGGIEGQGGRDKRLSESIVGKCAQLYGFDN